VTALRVGVALAALVAGPPLYALVDGGGLGSDAGLLRFALVAAACAVGAGAVTSLVRRYEADARRRRRDDLLRQARTALEGGEPSS
jgi:uncharacterized membrane protein YccC